MSVICQRGWESQQIFPGAKAEIWKNRQELPLCALETVEWKPPWALYLGDEETRSRSGPRCIHNAGQTGCLEKPCPAVQGTFPLENILLIQWKFQGREDNPLSQILQRVTLKCDINAPALYSYLLNSEPTTSCRDTSPSSVLMIKLFLLTLAALVRWIKRNIWF